MTVINTNIPSITAVNQLKKNTMSLNASIERLSTGYKINRASDGPASLVISEKLRAQMASLQQATENTERATNIIRTAESALAEVNQLLVKIQDLTVESANDGALTKDEILANQAEVDSAIDTINRIANTTTFGSISLLDGNGSDYVLSGVARANFSEIKIFGANISNLNSNLTVHVQVTQQASQAILSNTAAGIHASGATIMVTGNRGTEVLNFASSAANSAIVVAFNGVSANTGVTATLSAVAGGTHIYYQSEFYGADQHVTVSDISNLAVGRDYMNQRDEGTDIAGTINSHVADGDGLSLKVNSFDIKAEITVSSNYYVAQNDGVAALGSAATSTFTITEGGFAFNIGDKTDDNDKVFIGIQRMTSDNLGDRSVGFLNSIVTGQSNDLLTNAEQAGKIILEAIDDVTRQRARLGALESNTLNSNLNSLEAELLNITTTESSIRDTDFAAETADFTKNQILVQAGTSMVAQANVAQQNVLQLLG